MYLGFNPRDESEGLKNSRVSLWEEISFMYEMCRVFKGKVHTYVLQYLLFSTSFSLFSKSLSSMYLQSLEQLEVYSGLQQVNI